MSGSHWKGQDWREMKTKMERVILLQYQLPVDFLPPFFLSFLYFLTAVLIKMKVKIV